MKLIYSSLLAFFLFAGCNPSKNTGSSQAMPEKSMVIQGKLYGAAYMQRAAEYRALCLQAYNIAHLRLDEALQLASEKPRAIITDLDETTLDNSAVEVQQDLSGIGFEPKAWTEWTAKGIADTIAGSVSFFKYAASKNVEIFYITNRDENDRAGTLQNLQRYNYPNADNEHLLVRQNTSGKEARRQQVMKDHNVVLLLGDNLSDFTDLFDKQSSGERGKIADQQSAQFGKRFIVLPNPVYGDWESALYNYKSLKSAQKDSAIKASLRH